MSLKRIELITVAIFLVVSFAEFLPQLVPIRIIGQNVLNQRFWLNIAVLMILICDVRSLLSKRMYWVYIYFAVYILLELVGHYNLSGFGSGSRYYWFREQHFSIGISVLLAVNYIRKERLSDLKFLVTLSFYLILIMCLYNIYLIIRFPGVVRGTEAIAMGENEISRVRRIGLSSYVFFSALPFLIPFLVYRAKSFTSMYANWSLARTVPIIIVLVCSYMAVIVAPFLISVMALFFAVVGSRRFKANFSIGVVFLLIFLLIPKTYVGGFFEDAAHVTSNKDISTKLSEIGDIFKNGMEFVTYDDQAVNSIEGRASRVRFNLNNFVISPIIGTGQQSNGHIYWLNILAQFGIMGILPLYMLIRSNVRANLRILPYYTHFTYILTIISFIILGFMKAVAGNAMFLLPFFVVPGLLYVQSMQRQSVTQEI